MDINNEKKILRVHIFDILLKLLDIGDLSKT